ncbi:MAG TPA: hypothetical protein VF646_16725, partial [Cytophagales bacterium]
MGRGHKNQKARLVAKGQKARAAGSSRLFAGRLLLTASEGYRPFRQPINVRNVLVCNFFIEKQIYQIQSFSYSLATARRGFIPGNHKPLKWLRLRLSVFNIIH